MIILSTLTVHVLVLALVMGHPQLQQDRQSRSPRLGNPLSSHLLDTVIGRPVPEIKVILFKKENDQWSKICEQYTNSDGRVSNLISTEDFTPGSYKLHFDTKPYYSNQGVKTFYPYIQVIFQVENTKEHYHVPILLSAYGFATYRGS